MRRARVERRRRFATKRQVLLLVLGAGLLLGVQAVLQTLAERRASLGGAALIWARGPIESQLPIAVVLARDFELDEIPAGVEASLMVDEEYLLYLNGVLVGSGRYDPGEAVDRYEVTDLLKPGRNRVAVVARSITGAGALLFELADAAGNLHLVSDADWSVYLQHRQGILEGTALLAGGAPPLVWGLPPIGRWQIARPSAPRDRVPLAPPLRRASGAAVEELARDAGVTAAGARSVYRLDFGPGNAGLGVTGYLELWADLPHAATKVILETAPEASEGGAPTSLAASRALNAIPWLGWGRWRAAVPSTFRYAVVVIEGDAATAPLAGAVVWQAAADALPEPITPPRGPFGLEPPRSAPELDRLDAFNEGGAPGVTEETRGGPLEHPGERKAAEVQDAHQVRALALAHVTPEI